MTAEDLATLIHELSETDKKFSDLLVTLEKMADQAPRNINARRTVNYLSTMIWNCRWALFHALATQGTPQPQEPECQTTTTSP